MKRKDVLLGVIESSHDDTVVLRNVDSGTSPLKSTLLADGDALLILLTDGIFCVAWELLLESTSGQLSSLLTFLIMSVATSRLCDAEQEDAGEDGDRLGAERSQVQGACLQLLQDSTDEEIVAYQVW